MAETEEAPSIDPTMLADCGLKPGDWIEALTIDPKPCRKKQLFLV
jgi:hypothetical protein